MNAGKYMAADDADATSRAELAIGQARQATEEARQAAAEARQAALDARQAAVDAEHAASGARSGVAVNCVDLSHVYRTDETEVTALRDVSFAVSPGGRLALLGPSGSGKSTLLTLLAGLHRPTRGQLWVGDDDLAQLPERRLLVLRGTRIATVVQSPGRNLLPYGTAEDNIRFAQRPIPRANRSRLPTPPDLLAALGLAEFSGRRVARLSGGEQQRLSIAVGLARAPGLLLLDEPTSQLDTVSRDKVLDLLARLSDASGCTVIAVTHDPEVARALGAALRLSDGALVGAR